MPLRNVTWSLASVVKQEASIENEFHWYAEPVSEIPIVVVTNWTPGEYRCVFEQRHYMVRGKMVFDGVNKRIREFEDMKVNSTETYYDKLKLYNEDKEYTLDLKTRKCTVAPPNHPFHSYGVPPGGVFKAEAVIGAAGIPGESVTIADFAESANNSGFYSIVTEPSCFPVHTVFFRDDGLEEINFYDLQEGITDPMAFEIPKECNSL